MDHVKEMLKTVAMQWRMDVDMLSDCIDKCQDCAQVCVTCANACLHEDDVKILTPCIELNQYCADICRTTTNMLSRQTGMSFDLIQNQIQLCLDACRSCAEECEKHGSHHDHCRICAEACRQCENACSEMMSSTVSSGR